MQFNSLAFTVFFVVVFVLYYALPSKRVRAQNVLLLVASCVFYGWWDWRFLSLIGVSVLSTYATARLAAKSRPKLWTAANVVLNLAILCLFKYFNFFSDNLVALAGTFGWALDMPTVEVLLPVGISFYTFQAISYSVDVYRRDYAPERNLVSFALYICYFPQLVAGPIERASVLLPQINGERRITYPELVLGMRQALWGLVKKVVVADGCVHYVDTFFRYELSPAGAATATIAAFFFSVQIYCDFSGYCDIARGVSRMLGIRIMQNFRYPYFSTSVQEFWRRWNVSLMNWFRDYVYIPLGGSRRGAAATYRNVLVVFMLSGLWHGASWNFVIWGTYWGVVMVLYRYLRGRGLRLDSQWLTLALAVIGWVIFRSEGLRQTAGMLALTAVPVVVVLFGAHLALVLWRRIGPNGRKCLALVGAGAAVAFVVTHAALAVHHLIAVYIAGVFAVEWLQRDAVFGLTRMPSKRAARYALYYLLILLLLINVHGNAQFIYFKF